MQCPYSFVLSYMLRYVFFVVQLDASTATVSSPSSMIDLMPSLFLSAAAVVAASAAWVFHLHLHLHSGLRGAGLPACAGADDGADTASSLRMLGSVRCWVDNFAWLRCPPIQCRLINHCQWLHPYLLRLPFSPS